MLSIFLLGTICGLATGQLNQHDDDGLHQNHFVRESHHYCPVFYFDTPDDDCNPPPDSFIDFSFESQEPPDSDNKALEDAYEALEVLQDEFFEPNYGFWPSAIDWTAAVAETIISGMLITLTKSLGNFTTPDDKHDWKEKENLLSSYFAQIVNSYYGQDIVSLRGEAYDDMLWVVLGWIEALNFVREHASHHYPREDSDDSETTSKLRRALKTRPWHGESWLPAFAHRARIFWNLASKGWDTALCDGGMVWDRRLSPYKNAITNELWISASISMYQFFPGDKITAPWMIHEGYRKKDPAHLKAAVEGYSWLMDVGMRNWQGLFTDGFHISRRYGNAECDLRNNMVYTYNQGTLLTGNRGLWTVSGSPSYLEDGHGLIQAVIRATGWQLEDRQPIDEFSTEPGSRLPPWRGLGRGGIMEERCDLSGTCSQDAQIFKGIFFHHLVTFCAPLDPITVEDGMTVDVKAYERVKSAHAEACRAYLPWVRHNALAALGTRNSKAVFGSWWTAGLFDDALLSNFEGETPDNGVNMTDYRNHGTPQDGIWGAHQAWSPGGTDGKVVSPNDMITDQHVLSQRHSSTSEINGIQDPNERGRGRSMETQLSGLALLRAYWELLQIS